MTLGDYHSVLSKVACSIEAVDRDRINRLIDDEIGSKKINMETVAIFIALNMELQFSCAPKEVKDYLIIVVKVFKTARRIRCALQAM